MSNQTVNNGRQPVAIVGAGDLVAHVHRQAVGNEQEEYTLSVFRMGPLGDVTHQLRAGDLRDLVKLCQVLAFAVDDDGWSSPERRRELRRLESDLDAVTSRWGKRDA